MHDSRLVVQKKRKRDTNSSAARVRKNRKCAGRDRTARTVDLLSLFLFALTYVRAPSLGNVPRGGQPCKGGREKKTRRRRDDERG